MCDRRESICADAGGWNVWRDRSVSNLTLALDRFDITDVIGFDPLEISAVSFAANEGSECVGAVDFSQVRVCMFCVTLRASLSLSLSLSLSHTPLSLSLSLSSSLSLSLSLSLPLSLSLSLSVSCTNTRRS